MDIFDDKKRSQIMRNIKNKNTKPELQIRKLLTQMGYKYRLSTKELVCRPDIVFPGKKKVIFINGCFWHGHDCPRGKLPKTNIEFWKSKIDNNKLRDLANCKECNSKDWEYLTIWQCEIKRNLIDSLKMRLSDFLK